MRKNNKDIAEFDVQDMLPIGMAFVILIIGIAIGLQTIGNMRTSSGITGCADRSDGFTTTTAAGLCANSSGSTTTPISASYNATGEGQTALGILTSNLDTVAYVVIAAVIIGILFRYMMGGVNVR